MQEMNYEINTKNLVVPYDDVNLIMSVINAFLNVDEEAFNIMYKSNNEVFNKENLIFTNQVQGVLQIKALSLSTVNDGTESKEFTISIMVPLNEENKKYNDCISTLIKNINNQQFSVNDSVSLTFKNVSMLDANRLSKPINGVEYELIIVNGSVITSKQFLQATEEYLIIDGAKLGGVIDIVYTCLKTTDPDVFGLKSPIQKNTVNGVQIAIEVDLQIYKEDELHKKILVEAEEKHEYSIKYYNGLFEKEYNMILLQATITGITGDSVKGKFSFVIGE